MPRTLLCETLMYNFCTIISIQSGHTENLTASLTVYTCHDTKEKMSWKNAFAFDKWLVNHWWCLSVS